MGFEYPPIYDLPPFFTIQPIEETRQRQVALWVDIITRSQLESGSNVLHVNESVSAESVFRNDSINRRLDEDGIRLVLNALVDQGYGMWDSESQISCYTSPRKFQDWANSLYSWAKDTSSTNAILTLYELSQGDATTGEGEFAIDFHGVDCVILLQAVRLLHEQKKAVLIEAGSADETGVKFLDSR